jgi:hypothetical protein
VGTRQRWGTRERGRVVDPRKTTETATTRETLHKMAAHVLGRARFQSTGRFGLRASPGGFATPAFADGPEVLRVAAGALVRETADGATFAAIDGATLRELAAVAGVAIEEGFSVGADTPTTGDVDKPLVLDLAAARILADWLDMGQQVLDRVCAAMPAEAAPAVIQLWPEHFDLATTVTLRGGGHATLGASLGDSFSDDPYLYVGPWGDVRPGDASYWNAPFGALRRRNDLDRTASGDRPGEAGRFEAATGFFRAGLAMLGYETGG